MKALQPAAQDQISLTTDFQQEPKAHDSLTPIDGTCVHTSSILHGQHLHAQTLQCTAAAPFRVPPRHPPMSAWSTLDAAVLPTMEMVRVPPPSHFVCLPLACEAA